MSHPIPTHENDNVYPDDNYSAGYTHYKSIIESVKTIQTQVDDLLELVRKPAFTYDENGKLKY